MRIYIAARFVRCDEMNQYASVLRTLGHTVECRWLQGLHQIHAGASEVQASGDSVPLLARPFAQDDIEDIGNADMVISFTEKPFSDKGRGGRHVEFGYALGTGKRVIIIGSRENVFHCLPQVKQYLTFEEFISELRILNV